MRSSKVRCAPPCADGADADAPPPPPPAIVLADADDCAALGAGEAVLVAQGGAGAGGGLRGQARPAQAPGALCVRGASLADTAALTAAPLHITLGVAPAAAAGGGAGPAAPAPASALVVVVSYAEAGVPAPLLLRFATELRELLAAPAAVAVMRALAA